MPLFFPLVNDKVGMISTWLLRGSSRVDMLSPAEQVHVHSIRFCCKLACESSCLATFRDGGREHPDLL